MKSQISLCGIAAVLMAATILIAADVKLEGVKCIMNPKAAAKADKAVDYKGGHAYFCCDNCPKGFAAKIGSDAGVQARANHQLIATGQAVQGKCPFTGGKLNADTAIAVNGASIAFCCNNCKGKAEGLTGDEQFQKLFSDAAFTKAEFKVPAADAE